ncbi:dolichyl-phosphate-mannose--protein O-mannosyl transferase [Aeromicrobium panaciterrae]|uniref:Polyprenol-phosphate-mannose--protein mannosyltransferase n=1 Tax=Aeromicrobium panaciterrae TaxID=363861 RepID=A0ABU1ULQ1_9ACTN|nr:phospholipid carrier-dependent glycosyltransferase [Aeromicrobium panaciterrae]MDR7086083.1 dolichyl-phosphate-mannose--protein O-mannosyl transferase [Aeromicrobium panaciterrae]
MIVDRVSRSPYLKEGAWGWIGPIGVAALAFVIRIWNVGYPNRLMFDETYYAKDAWSLLKHGYVQDYIEKANEKVVAGDLTGLMTGQPTQITHPDGGKWIIAIGEQIFGLDSFGWRISAVVVGALTVLVLARLVRRLTGSTIIGCFAGLLLCFDGLHFVMSRIALLDGFLAFWIISGVACLVADRDWVRERLHHYRVFRPWQLLAGVCFGMACGTKWSGVYVLAVFGVLVVIWEVLARREHTHDRGLKHHWVRTTLAVGTPAFFSIVSVAFVVYIATWTGWLIHHDLYEQRFGQGIGEGKGWGAYISDPTRGPFGSTIDAFRSLWHFHVITWDFHTGSYLAGKTHPYQSNPLGWLVMERPVGVDAQNNLPAASCGASATSSCMREVLLLGNPVLWWTGALALMASVVAWFTTKTESLKYLRWEIPILGVAASWLPWFISSGRPIFSFYAVVSIPFTIIALSLVVSGLVKAAETPRQRYAVWLVAGVLVTAVIATFWYFHPIYTDDLITYDSWRDRMWFNRWI